MPKLYLISTFSSFNRYTKYLYPYECEMKRLSTPTELQQAIDGNKREGRRSGYDTYSMFPGPRPQVPLPPSSLPMPQISPLPPGLRPSSNGFPGFPGSLRKLLCSDGQPLQIPFFCLSLSSPIELPLCCPAVVSVCGNFAAFSNERHFSLVLIHFICHIF